MEIQNSKQQQLTFEKGITNVPSDAICSDNTLEESMGMVYENGEHRVIQKPVEDGTVNGTLVFVHGGRRIYTNNGGVYYNNVKICDYNGMLSVTAIGNTLVMSHNDGVVYAKWKGSDSQYEYYSDLPEISFYPYLVPLQDTIQVTRYPLNIEGDFYGVSRTSYIVNNDGTYEEVTTPTSYCNADKYTLGNEVEKSKTFQDYITGAVEEYIDMVKKDHNAFMYPFWVRFALELYDGSITKQSPPILMCASVRAGVTMVQTNAEQSDPQSTHPYSHENDWFKPYSNLSLLHFRLVCPDIEGYDDVVKGVKIYISKDVRTEKTNDDKWEFYSPIQQVTKRRSDFVMAFSDALSSVYTSLLMDKLPTAQGEGVQTYYKSFIYAPQKSDKEIMSELMEQSVFYELCEIPYTDLKRYSDEYGLNHIYNAEDLMSDNALLNLTTLTQMPHDDYYSHSKISKGKLYAYNSRINVYDFKRKAFEGFKLFVSENTLSEHFITYVTISTNSGQLKVKHEFYSSWIMGYYFYYPDPRATNVDIYIYRDNTWKLVGSYGLREHPYLNGAYSFERLPYDTGSVYNPLHDPVFDPNNFYYPTETSVNPATLKNDDLEELPNTIMTSEVNNPFVFYAEGTNEVGSGRIIGLATQTVALSDGTEFGKQPLIVFTDKGLWSLTVSKEGLYATGGPMPREVCNNPNSITEVDGAVFFSSAKGLMILVGSQVKCVSEQLSGKSDTPFQAYLKNAYIAYDYRDSLLWIFYGATHPVDNTQITGSQYCYIYSVKSGTFARYDFGSNSIISNVVADYPDYLLQSEQNIYSLMGRDNINEDNRTYAGQIITRPMKLENAFALKKLIQVRHVSQMEGSMTLHIFASNNLNHWGELHSLLGTPWKYYKFQYDFENLKATDRFAGSVIITQESRENKLR